MNPQGHQIGDAAHERKDADVINLAMIAALLVTVIVVCLLVCWAVLHFFKRERQAQQLPQEQTAVEVAAFPAPKLLEHPGTARSKLESSEKTQLDTYGWVDRSRGVVHIPIARAMQLLVQRGLPAVGAGQTPLQLMQSRPQTNVVPNEPRSESTPESNP